MNRLIIFIDNIVCGNYSISVID